MSARLTTLALIALLALTALVVFASCKPKPRSTTGEPTAHEGSIAEGIDCANCHTEDGWQIGGATSDGSGFNHDETGFPLNGRHGSAMCTDCHAPGTQVDRNCASCHEDVHQGRMTGSCDTCHTARGFELTNAIEMHRRTLLPLTGMHVLAECTECHQRRGERFMSHVPTDCFGCHEADFRRPDIHPNHLGDADSPPFPRDCTRCHQPMGWVPAFIDVTALPRSQALTASSNHDLSFPISFGSHRGAQCESCHTSTAVPRLVQCTGCHAHNPVQLRLDHPNLHVSTDGPGCLSCHAGGMAR